MYAQMKLRYKLYKKQSKERRLLDGETKLPRADKKNTEKFRKNRPNSQTEVQLIFDTERNRYQVLNIRW